MRKLSMVLVLKMEVAMEKKNVDKIDGDASRGEMEANGADENVKGSILLLE